MKFSVQDWHDRFSRQARWTTDLRRFLLTQYGLEEAARILEVGCGTGAVIDELVTMTHGIVIGLDINISYLRMAMRNAPTASLTAGDGYHLPFPDRRFDLTCCHFLLLWVSNPTLVVREMARVTRTGGVVAAFAEPDHGGRIDYPAPLEKLGQMQSAALSEQGANPLMGRQLAGVFKDSGLVQIRTGVLGGQWANQPSQSDLDSEWAVLRSDLTPHLSEKATSQWQALDLAAWQSGQRVLFVPTFYAWGHVADQQRA